MAIELSKNDVIWSYLGTILSMAANFFMLPFIIYYLNGDMLGLWYVFSSVGQIAVLFDCGFEVTFARNITYCWSGAKTLKKEDVDFTSARVPNFFLMKKVIFACKTIYFLISASALILLFTLGTVYIHHISINIEGIRYYYAWIIYCIAVYLNLYYGYYASFLRGVGAVAQANKNTVIARSAQILLTLILLFLGFDLIGVCVAYLAYGTIFRYLGKMQFYEYKNIGTSLETIKTQFSFADIKEIFLIVWHNAWKDGVISIANYLSDQASTIICSLYLSLTTTGIYSLGMQIATAISVIAGTLYNTYQPALQEAYVTKNKEKMLNTMSVIVVTFILLFILGMIATLSFGIPILKFVKANAVISVPVLSLLCLYQFILKFRNCYTSYFSCTNRILYLKSFVLSSVLSIVLSLIAMAYFGLEVYGLICAQIISQIAYNAWYWAKKAHKEMQTTFFDLFNNGYKLLKLKIIKK